MTIGRISDIFFNYQKILIFICSFCTLLIYMIICHSLLAHDTRKQWPFHDFVLTELSTFWTYDTQVSWDANLTCMSCLIAIDVCLIYVTIAYSVNIWVILLKLQRLFVQLSSFMYLQFYAIYHPCKTHELVIHQVYHHEEYNRILEISSPCCAMGPFLQSSNHLLMFQRGPFHFNTS